MGKRVLCIVMAWINGLIACAAALFPVVAYIEHADGTCDLDVVITTSVLAVLILGVTAIIVNALYKSCYGTTEYEKKQKLNLWVRNLLFGVMLFIFVAVMTVLSITGHAESQPQKWTMLIMLAAVVAAMTFYLHNYRKTAGRKQRIRGILKQNCLHGTRRYVFLVEKSEGDELTGTLHGRIRAGDSVYIIQQNGKEYTGRITGIRTNGKKVLQASGGTAVLTIPGAAAVTNYATVTDIRQGHSKTPEISAENPMLRAVLYGFNDHADDEEYRLVLFHHIVNGYYLVPGRVPETETQPINIMDPLIGVSRVNLMSVTNSVLPDQSVMPIFSSWDAVERYEDLINDRSASVTVMSMEKVTDIAESGYDGVVIDPFGPRPYYISPDTLKSLKETEIWKQMLEKQEGKE